MSVLNVGKLNKILHQINKDTFLLKVRSSNKLFIDTGFAFSGGEGNDNLVTDNISNRFKDAIHK